MYDHEIRWYALIPVSLLLGLAVLIVEMSGWLPRFPARPDLFWCLAFFAALRSLPIMSIMAFGWCGLARDLLLGPKAGAASFAFVLVGWLALYWKPLAAARGRAGQAVAAGAGAFLVAAVKHGLDSGWLAPRLWERIFFIAIGDALLTALAYVPFTLLLSIPSFRPWRERSGFF